MGETNINKAELDALRDAVSWIRVLGEELVMASGDRAVHLASVRSLLRERQDAHAQDGETVAALYKANEHIAKLNNALEKLIKVTYTAAVEEGNKDVQMARIHARAAQGGGE